MIVTQQFVYIHTSRTGGTFLNKLIMEHVPGARMIQYHGHLADLPEDYTHLPVIGFVRNPWDWYVSMYCDYRRKQQYVYQILSDRGVLGFRETVARFLNLGDNSIGSKRLLDQLGKAAPTSINAQAPGRRGVPGLRSEHFANFPENQGYYSWLFRLMFKTGHNADIRIGRFEKLREEALRLFEECGTPITNEIDRYLQRARALNPSPRPSSFTGGYPPELEQLVAEKDKFVIDRYGYEFSESQNYPKTEYFSHLGTADVGALTERVRKCPESLWETENKNKPNKFARINETRRIIFRFLSKPENMFDFHDHPVLWDEWKNDLLPIMEQAAQSLGYENYQFPRVMFAKLAAGGEVSGHSDGEASHYIHKIHVPLITNKDTLFQVGRQSKHLPVGEIYEVNNKRVHSVRNDGNEDRIHFIFECYNVDDYGKRA